MNTIDIVITRVRPQLAGANAMDQICVSLNNRLSMLPDTQVKVTWTIDEDASTESDLVLSVKLHGTNTTKTVHNLIWAVLYNKLLNAKVTIMWSLTTDSIDTFDI